MPGLLDIIGQALSMPTNLALQKAQLQQAQLGNAQGLMSTGLMGQTLSDNGMLPQGAQGLLQRLGIGPTSQQPQQQPSQQPDLSALAGGATGMINAAQPHGGLLPQTTQSPTGPVTSFPLLSPQAQAAAPQQSPQQAQGSQQSPQLDPWQEYQRGMGLVSSPVSQYLPFLKSRGQAMMDEAKLRLQNDPTYLTQQAVAKDQQTQDLAILAAAQKTGDADRIAQAQAKLQRDTLGGVPLTNVPGGVGGAPQAQINPVTHEYKPVTQPGTGNYIVGQNTDGTPIIRTVPTAQAVANGYTPYSPFAATQGEMGGPAGALQAALTQAGITLPGGRSGQQLAQTLGALIRANPGKSSQEIADMVRTGQLDFNGAKRSTGQLSQVLASTTAFGLQLEKNLDSLASVQNAVDATGVPILNRAFAAFKQNLSGGKDIAKYTAFFNAAASEYAKIISGGTGVAAPSEGDMKEARRVMVQAYTSGGLEGLRDALTAEANNKRASYQEGLNAAGRTSTATNTPAPINTPAPATSAAPPADIQALLKKYGGR